MTASGSHTARRLDHDWYPEPLPENVRIGERSWLYSSFAFLHYASRRPNGVSIGKDTGVYNGTFFDLGPAGEVQIGDFCALVGAIICTNRRVVIEDYVFIAHEVMIADTDAAAPLAAPGPADSTAAPQPGTFIGEGAWIGANAAILSGARIGKGAIIGAGAIVTADVPDFAVAAGNPARVVARLR